MRSRTVSEWKATYQFAGLNRESKIASSDSPSSGAERGSDESGSVHAHGGGPVVRDEEERRVLNMRFAVQGGEVVLSVPVPITKKDLDMLVKLVPGNLEAMEHALVGTPAVVAPAANGEEPLSAP